MDLKNYQNILSDKQDKELLNVIIRLASSVRFRKNIQMIVEAG